MDPEGRDPEGRNLESTKASFKLSHIPDNAVNFA